MINISLRNKFLYDNYYYILLKYVYYLNINTYIELMYSKT